jgi:hypothetical protein
MGIDEWTIVETPGSVPSLNKAIFSPSEQGSEINKIVIGSDGESIWAIVRRGDRNGIDSGGSQTVLYRSINQGLIWYSTPYDNLVAIQSSIANGTFIWDIAIAPDDPNIIAVACADIRKGPLEQEVWLSTDQGASWRNTQWPPNGIEKGVDLISTMDISIGIEGHTILVGTRDSTGLGTNNLQIMHMTNYGVWNVQNSMSEAPSIMCVSGDILAAKFSPSFFNDRTVVVVYSDGTSEPDHRGTWLATGVYDVLSNNTKWQPRQEHVEIRNYNSSFGDSPRVDEIITANIELPADFSGQDSKCRHFYVSTDAVDRVEGITPNRGIYRIDDNCVYTLMDNTATYGSITSSSVIRRISSIAFWGTCKSGKLLAGEVLSDGYEDWTPTWFSDLLAVAPAPWYPNSKPISGFEKPSLPRFKNRWSYCNVQVAWNPSGAIAYAATGAASLGPWAIPSVSAGALVSALAWPAGYVNVVPLDESAFSISRNSGRTWNQISLIDTAISNLADVAPALDSRTLYLASVNLKHKASSHIVVYSVWRSSSDAAVVSTLLPALPLGTIWERILTLARPSDCNHEESESAILRLSPDKTDGQMVFFAPSCTNVVSKNTENIILWSPDYGDYWALITPAIAVQDMTLLSSTQLYVLAANGDVQRLAYTGTKWATTTIRNAGIPGHMIQASYEDWVIVGSHDTSNVLPAVAYSSDLGETWKHIHRPAENANGHVHVAFHPDFHNNRDIYAGFDGALGIIHHFTIGTSERWSEVVKDTVGIDDYMTGCYGLCFANTAGALYSVHIPGQEFSINSTVSRILWPAGSMSESENQRELLRSFQPLTIAGVAFTREPYPLKLSGCLTLDTDTVMFAIDARDYVPTKLQGMLWIYTDSTGKRGTKATIDTMTLTTRITGVTVQPHPTPQPVSFGIQPITEAMAELLRTRAQLSQVTTPVLLTEGKTDVAILRVAWQKLYQGKRRNFYIESCDPLPHELGVGGAGGIDTLKMRLITVPHNSPNKQIGLFDRDREGIKAFQLDGNFVNFKFKADQKVHKNQKAYAFLIPVPPGMEEFQQYRNLPIEFLFEEKYLRKKVDNQGLVLTPRKVQTTVEGQTIDEKPADKLVFMRIEKDSKKWFAEKVVPILPTKAFKNFTLIFDVIKAMIDD